MADPLSIAGSLAGLAQITASTFITVFKYVKDVQSAKDDVDKLAREIRNFYGIVQNLYLLCTGLEQTGSRKPTLEGSQVMLCTATLSRIEKKVDRASKKHHAGGSKGRIQSLKWPFSKNETKELLEELERHKSTINTALAADTIDLLMQSLGIQNQMQNKLDRAQTAIEKLKRIQDDFMRDEKNKAVERFFLPVNPMHGFQSNIRLKQEDTGHWFHQSYELLNWMAIPNSKLWLSGIPGSGKSVMCASLIERVVNVCGNAQKAAAIKGDAAVFFFCDYKVSESQQLVNILQVLALQLARQHKDAFDILEDYFESLVGGDSLPKDPESPKLLELMSLMCKPFSKVFVIVDALDECDKHCAEVVQGLKHLATDTLNMSIAVFSRNEPMIRDELVESYTHLEIAAHTEDLELFVGAELQRRQLAPTEIKEIRSILVLKAQGINTADPPPWHRFRWVVCQLDYLQGLGTGARKRALDGLPPTLNETYDRILRGQISSANKASTRNIARKALHCICSVSSGLSIEGLCLAISIDHSKDDFDRREAVHETEVLRACSSLVRKDSFLNTFELAHFSVKEYLQDIDPNGPLGEFSLSTEAPSAWLASTCVRYLTFKKFRCQTRYTSDGWLIAKRRREYDPFYAFAARSWRMLYKPIECTPLQPSEHLRLLFDPEEKTYLQNWFVEYLIDKYAYRNEEYTFSTIAAYVTRQDVTPLHVAASLGLHSVCSWLIDAGVSVNAKSEVGTPLACALAGPEVFVGGPAKVTTLYNKTASPHDIGLTIKRLMRDEIDLEVPSTEVSFSGRALQLCQWTESCLPLIPFIGTPGALCTDMIPMLEGSELLYDGPVSHDIFQEILDADAKVNKNDSDANANKNDSNLAAVASYVRTKILSLGDWDYYGHLRGSFTPKSIKDEHFKDYVSVAAAQNRVDEMKVLVLDVRFSTLGMKADPLHVAMQAKNFEIINVIMSSDIDFESYMKKKGLKSPLLICRTDHHLPALRLFLDAGFDHLEPTPEDEDGPEAGNTIWHLAAANNALQILKALLVSENRLEALRTLSSAGRTPLTEAIEKNQEDAALLLLDECPKGEAAYFESSQPLLQLAARLGSDTLYQGLLQKGVTAGLDSPDGSTPLHYINWRIELSLLRRLLLAHDVDKRRADGRTAAELFLLHINSKYRLHHWRPGDNHRVEHPVFDALFKKTPVYVEADKNNVPIWEFFCQWIIEPPYRIVQRKENRNIGEQLVVPAIKAMTAGVNNALLEYVAYRHQSAIIPVFVALVKLPDIHFRETWVYEVVRIILDVSGDPASYRNTPVAIRLLKAAVMHGHTKVVRIMMSKGWDVFRREGLSCALEVACECSPAEVSALLVNPGNRHRLNEIATINGLDLVGSIIAGPTHDVPPKFKYLLAQGLDPNKATTGDSKYPFVVAAAIKDRFDIVALLEEYGAGILAQGPDGMDVAKAAAFHGNLDMLRRIHAIASEYPDKYDWNSRLGLVTNSPGHTAGRGKQRHILHFAAEGGHVKVLRFLLCKSLVPPEDEGGINVQNAEGLTPLQEAWRAKRYDALRFLIEQGADLPSDGSYMAAKVAQKRHARRLGSIDEAEPEEEWSEEEESEEEESDEEESDEEEESDDTGSD
ncbi:hypothetical protein PG985_000516 [Apiospora marii]|uniref:NACHT domain-containing protein n=1 Tax=Apiospora marii TaxID=335849 RepID=A0ABR1R2F2_9PEZI